MKRLFAIISLVILARGAEAVTIAIDYSYDTYFSSHSAARTTLEAAAADLSAALRPTLTAVNTDTYTGTSAGKNATANWSLYFTNPTTNASVQISTFNATTVSADKFTIYVGMQPLAGSTLGEGGPGWAGASLSGSSGVTTQAITNLENISNLAMRRGGPVIGSLSGTLSAKPFALQYGAFVGNLWFDNDTDNSGGIDSDATLESKWYFGLDSAIPSGKNDFYSVALHEMMHALGVGASETWNEKRVGNDWLGPQVLSLTGGNGVGLLSGGSHIASNKMSPRLSDGVMQEVVMDPTLTTGSRKMLTQLDVAFLRDIGYAAVPEPSSGVLALFGVLALVRRRR